MATLAFKAALRKRRSFRQCRNTDWLFDVCLHHLQYVGEVLILACGCRNAPLRQSLMSSPLVHEPAFDTRAKPSAMLALQQFEHHVDTRRTAGAKPASWVQYEEPIAKWDFWKKFGEGYGTFPMQSGRNAIEKPGRCQ
jgi:hypothetical protein